MKKKKWMFLSLIILLTVAVLFVNNAFNGNPISKHLAKSTLISHLEKTYPNNEFRINDAFFSFKDNGYHFKITRIGDADQTDYEFIVTGVFGSTVSYDTIYWKNQDTALIDKLRKEANAELTTLLQNEIEEVVGVDVQLEVLKNKYSAETKWTKEFKPERPMYMHIIIDAEKLSPKDVVHAAEMIREILNRNGYSYRQVGINANIFDFETSEEDNWYVKYAISFEKDSTLGLKQVEQFSN